MSDEKTEQTEGANFGLSERAKENLASAATGKPSLSGTAPQEESDSIISRALAKVTSVKTVVACVIVICATLYSCSIGSGAVSEYFGLLKFVAGAVIIATCAQRIAPMLSNNNNKGE